MKNLFKATNAQKTNMSTDLSLSGSFHWNTVFNFGFVLLLIALLFTGCMKHDVAEPKDLSESGNDPQSGGLTNMMSTDEDFSKRYRGCHQSTLSQLRQARAGTEKYKKIENAFKDEYEDLEVVVPNMGYHFMRRKNVNATFDPANPEILVYNKNEHGCFELVAVEYAVPIDVTPYKAPEGFTGNADVWEKNVDFGLWLCHAWVWKYNPAGIFHDTNPLVTVH